ncbi:hypothetical protein Tco_0695850 [Tanacetum coccineum]
MRKGMGILWKLLEWSTSGSYRIVLTVKSFCRDPTTCPKCVQEDGPKASPMAVNRHSSMEDQEEGKDTGGTSKLGDNGHREGSTNDKDNSYHKDDVNVIDLKNSFANLMEEDKVLDECIKEGDVDSSGNVDGKDKGANDCIKVVNEEVKSQEHGSLLGAV